jgi:hypothetical protein
MKKTLTAAVFAATLAGIGAASAFPLAPLNSTDATDVIQVAQGCGPGWARGPYGRCHRMGGAVYVAPRAVYVAPRAVVVAPRVCPPGFGFRYGRCRRF